MNPFSFVFGIFLAIWLTASPLVFSQGPESERLIETKLSLLEQKLNRLKEMHSALTVKQTEIKNQIAGLKIWARHRS